MKIHHVSITVNDLEESRNFYDKFFGFSVYKEFERKDLRAKAVFLKLKDFYMELWQFADICQNVDDLKDIKIKGIRHIAFEVSDLDEIIENFKKNDIEVLESKLGASGHYYSFTYDPNGIALELYQK